MLSTYSAYLDFKILPPYVKIDSACSRQCNGWVLPAPNPHHPHNTADCELITNRAAESGESVCHIFYSARMIVNKRSG